MKNSLLLLFCSLLYSFCYAQDPISYNPNNNNASVQLSWLNNIARLRVGGSGLGAENGFDFQGPGNFSFLRILGNGNIGIGITSPIDKLTIDEGNITLGNTTNKEYNIIFRPSDNSWRSALIGYSSNIVANDYIGLRTTFGSIRFITNSGNEVVRITDNERVGIGTTTPGYKLAVNGTIGEKEVKVTTSGWPDFVFELDYNLPTLQEVENYIDQNGHLPDIPSAEEVEENGISLGEMNTKLLQKIEELTLYVIELKKENEDMKVKDEVKKKEIEELKSENQALKTDLLREIETIKTQLK